MAAVVVVIVVLGDWCRKVVGLEVDEDCDGVVKPQPNLKENGAGSVENSKMRKDNTKRDQKRNEKKQKKYVTHTDNNGHKKQTTLFRLI